MLSYLKPLPRWYHPDAPNDSVQPEPPDKLYHIILTTSHLSKDPNSQVEKLRVVGSYTSVAAAQAAAHRVLVEAGYGENVLVHTVGMNGVNILISVIQGQVLESARLSEAAMKIR